MLLAAVLLVARLMAPAAAMPANPGDAIEQIALHSLCHDGPAHEPDPGKLPSHHDCLLCPACHLLSLPALSPAGGPALHKPTPRLIGLATPLPPATGPPPRPRTVAQPTGPPLSV